VPHSANGLVHAPGALRPVVELTDLSKDYRIGSVVVHALSEVTTQIWSGELVAIMGPSGSGKSTFMNILGCLDRPTSGRYLLGGIDVSQLNARQLADVRGRRLGFVFQGYNLLPRMNALENVMLPMLYSGVTAPVRLERALAALDVVGLADRARHHPNELSGGQQQRVAIARTLVNAPSLILADEPTGNVDSRAGTEIMDLLQQLNQAGSTIVLVTHDPEIGTYCSRRLSFRDGRLTSDRPQEAASAEAVLAAWPVRANAA
jgi:putative ABC transport system ATP-binding protein